MNATNINTTSGRQPNPTPHTQTNTSSVDPRVTRAAAPQMGEIEISAEKSKAISSASASINKRNQDREIAVKRNFKWKGEQYQLNLHLPLSKPIFQLDKSELAQFKKQADELADLMVEDLRQQLDAQYTKPPGEPKIEPGDNCQVTFDESGKYVVAHEDDEASLNLDNPETFKGKRAHIAEGAASSAIAKAACARETLKMNQTLRSTELNSLREIAQKGAFQKAGNAAPINLVNDSNACWGNSAFQQLVNDDLVAEELADPANYFDGSQNRLFQAVQQYRKNQETGEKLNLFEILGLDPREQNDVMEAWFIFYDQFDLSAIQSRNPNSHLLALFTTNLRGSLAKGKSLNEIAIHAWGRKDVDPPDVLTLHLEDRLSHSSPISDLDKKLGDNEKKEFLKAILAPFLNLREEENLLPEQHLLTDADAIRKAFREKREQLEQTKNNPSSKLTDDEFAKQKYVLGVNLALALLKNSMKKADSELLDSFLIGGIDNDEFNDRDSIECANAILKNHEQIGYALEIIANDLPIKKKINQLRIATERNTTPVRIDGDGMVRLGQKTYELTSFSQHTLKGTSHFVTYVKKGSIYYKLNDLDPNSPTVITKQAFLSAAQTGSLYTFHKEGLSLPSKAPAVASANVKMKENTKINKNKDLYPNNKDKQILGTTTYLHEEEGTIEAVETDFTIINPSSTNLIAVHHQLESILSSEQLDQQVSTVNAANERWYKYGSAHPKYEPRNWLGAPNMLLTSGNGRSFIHIPLAGEYDVKQAVLDILTFAMKHKKKKIAIPILPGNSQAVAFNMKQAIAEFALEHTNDEWRGAVVKIVHPPQSISTTSTIPNSKKTISSPPSLAKPNTSGTQPANSRITAPTSTTVAATQPKTNGSGTKAANNSITGPTSTTAADTQPNTKRPEMKAKPKSENLDGEDDHPSIGENWDI